MQRRSRVAADTWPRAAIMTELFDQLLAHVEQSYRAIVAQSWTLLTAQTAPDNAAAIQTTCELQQHVILTGAAWLAGLVQVRTLAPVATPPVPAALQPPSGAPVSAAVGAEPARGADAGAVAAARPVRRPIRRSTPMRRRRRLASTQPLHAVTPSRPAPAPTPVAARVAADAPSGHGDDRAAIG